MTPVYSSAEALPLFVHYFKRPACHDIIVTVRPDGVVSMDKGELCRIEPAIAAVETVSEARRIATSRNP